MIRTRLAGAAIGLLVATTGAAQADTWRYAFEEFIDEVQGVFAQKFKEEVEANSDHEVQLFPFGTLGESADIMEQTQSGILQFVGQSPGFTGAVIPETQIFLVPYLLPQDQDELFDFFRTSTAINEMLPEVYAEHGLELLAMYPEGPVGITTQEPIRTPEDFDEVKIRVMTNPLLIEAYRAWGATPTPLPTGEIYGALQTGIIDGQENPTFYLESQGFYEVSNVITYLGHNNYTTAFMANKSFYDGLPEEDQQVIQGAADAAFEHILEYQRDLQEEALQKMREAKPELEINILSEEERQPFIEAAEQVEETYVNMAGERGRELLDQMKEDLAAVRN